jgi:F-type H+-transporting ATPase subunit a
MLILGAESPLGHVLDANIIGGAHPLVPATEGWNVFGSPILTLHMVTLIVAALLLVWVMKRAAAAIDTGPESEGHARHLTSGRLGQLVEVFTLYLRDSMLKPLLGDKTDTYLPYLLTLFFFILMNNLLGLVPLLDLQHIVGVFAGNSHFAVVGGTATGNLAVTAGLALIAFVVIQIHGLRENGIGGWFHHLLGGAPAYLAPIMVPVEMMSLIIKPAALAIRLFANMMAGHMLLATLALFGVMALNGMESWIAAFGVSILAGAFSVAISFLELFVAFLQSFIFMFLTAVFIAQLSHHGHEHDESHDSHEAEPELASL